jgi:DNA-binding CsgD family transcriptional regulator
MHCREVATLVNDAHQFSRERTIELSRLNEAERRVLLLLAEGHTAKSIATELESTPAAVNERLREARRKTGVGSSRELARLLKAQENRDEQTVVASGRAAAASPASSDAEAWRLQTGVFAMIAILVAAAGAAAVLTTQATTTSTGIDPLIGAIPSSADDPARVYARIRAEQRDPMWAPRMEDALRTHYSVIHHGGESIESLRIICSTTLCEVAGLIRASANPADEQSLKTPLNRTMQELQGRALHDELAKIGLESVSGYFGGGKPGKMIFLQYWSRNSVGTK